ncbi:hypothetical protein A4X13_0g7680 [Tilletia indica]|uniref:Uncharacterized protein n=1 Tax=Tilletia indica TaxID=43049 RepID=A0A8T8SHQ7_9BASI|nr:hypothetical protein A4X13_0g7680 [Tilletia indica]
MRMMSLRSSAALVRASGFDPQAPPLHLARACPCLLRSRAPRSSSSSTATSLLLRLGSPHSRLVSSALAHHEVPPRPPRPLCCCGSDPRTAVSFPVPVPRAAPPG